MKHTVARQGDHVAVFYHSPAERLAFLIKYFEEGLSQNELCIYVAQASARKVATDFKKCGLDIGQHLASGQLCIFEMNKTYFPDGKFMTDYMLRNVSAYISDAQQSGYNGLRTAGEMAWINKNEEFELESIIYEDAVNLLGNGVQKFTGTCLYPFNAKFAHLAKNALSTHPVFYYNGVLRANPDYVADRHDGLIKALDNMAASMHADQFVALQRRLKSARPI